MPFKQYINGAALTPDDLNTYLQPQTVMTFTSASARSAAITAPTEGMVTFLKDVDTLEVYSGTAWVPITNVAQSAGWTSFTPTLTASVSPVLGTGGSIGGRYVQIGKTVHFKGVVQFGSTGMTFGSGGYNMSLPVTARSTVTTFGVCIIQSATGSAYTTGWIPSGTTGVNFYVPASATDVKSSLLTGTSTPGGVAWGASAQIRFDMTYEAA